MRKNLILAFLGATVSITLAQNSGNCEIDEITDWTRYTNTAINDYEKLEKIFEANPPIELDSVSGDDYLTAAVEGNALIVRTTDDFEDFEKNQASSVDSVTLVTTIKLKCNEVNELSTLLFRQPIQDVNNHPPTFDEESYTYNLPMPLPAGMTLSYFGATITAEDIDITNTNIIYTVDSDDFEVETNGPVDALGKRFDAVIKTKRALRYTESHSFTLTATDVGTIPGPLTSQVKITIEVDGDNSYPETPSFTESYYTGDYISGDNHHINTDTISLSEDYDDTLDLSLEGEYKSYFDVQRDGQQVQVTLKNDLPSDVLEDESISTVILTIVATESVLSLKGSTVLLITLPAKEYVAPPTFTKSYYKGTYSVSGGSGKLSVEDIYLDNDYSDYESLDVNHEGELSEYFLVSQRNGEIEVTLSSDIPEDVLESQSVAILKITATNDDLTGYTIVVISLENEIKEAPSFGETYYTGSYSITNENGQLTTQEIRLDYADHNSVDLQLNGEHANYFKAENTGGQIVVTVRENLPEDVLETESVIILTIVATVEADNDLTDSAVLVISLPEKKESPNFDKPYYNGAYISSTEDDELDTESINLSDDYSDYDLVEVNLNGEYAKYFKAERDVRQIKVSLTEKLPTEVLETETLVILTIVATVKNKTNLTGSAVLLISLPERITPDPPKFDQLYYSGAYNIGEELDVLQTEAISLADDYTDYDSINLKLDGDYAAYFKVDRNERQIIVSVKENLPDEVLESKSTVIVEIVATSSEDAELTASAVLIISLPEPKVAEPPKFDQSYYSGVYSIGDELDVLETDPISLADDYTDYNSVDLKLVGDLAAYFKVDRNERQIIVSVKENLPDEVLESKSTVVVEIVATASEHADLTASAVLIISLPEPKVPEPPKFDQSYYSGIYSIGDELDVLETESISLADDYTDYNSVDLKLVGDLAAYFKVNRNERQITVSVIENLPDEVLESKSTVAVEIVATASEDADLTASAVLIISLPEKKVDEPPKFVESYYSGSYIAGNGEEADKLETEIISLNDDYSDYNSVDVTLSGDYALYFSAARSERQITVSVSENLPADVLESESTIVLTIVASVKDNADLTGSTILIISLPEKQSAPNFENLYYTASYSVDGENGQLDTEGTISLSSNYADYNSVDVNLEGEYSEYFKAERDVREVKVSLEKNLPTEVLETETVIILEIVATVKGNTDLKGSAVLLIELPTREDTTTEAPKFENLYYTGSYSIEEGSGQLNVENTISLSSDYDDYSSVEVTLNGDYANNFKAERNLREISLSIAENLPENVLETESVIVLELVATVKENTNLKGSAVLVIKLPAREDTNIESPKFEELYYTGSYKVEGEGGQLIVESTISLSAEYDDYDSIEVTLEGDYANYFEAERNVREIRLSVTENLPTNILETESVIVLELVATVKQSTNLKGSAVLVIKLPATECTTTDSPIFEELYYTGSYKVEDEIGQLTVDSTISLSTEYDDYNSVDVTLEGDYANYFKAERDVREITVSVAENLPTNVLQTESVVVLELVATVKDSTNLKGSSVLVIKLPAREETTTDSPKFEELYYTGNYKLEGEDGQLIVEGTISLSTEYDDYDSVEVTLEGEYANYFKAERNVREITVSVAESLPINVLETESVIVLELVATVKESTNLKGSAVLVIKLPATEGTTTDSPKFKELYYTGSYKVEDEIGQLTVDSTISLSTEYDDYNSVDVTLEGDYASYFKAERDMREIRLSVVENLPANVLETESVIVLELVATVKDSTNLKGSSVLVIKLPAREETTTDSPKFEELYYTGSYKVEGEGGQLIVESTISLSAEYGDYDSIEVTLEGEYSNYFKAELNVREITVSVAENLPTNILETESVIALELVATVKESTNLKGSAVLVIKLPATECTTTDSPIFEELYYTGSYKVEDEIGQLTVDSTISLSTEYDDYNSVDVTLEGDYANYFKAERDVREITVSVAENLPTNVLQTESVIVLELVATVKDSTNLKGSSVLVIKLPAGEETTTDSPKFEELYYTGNYKLEGEDGQLIVEGTISLSTEYDDYDSVEVTLEGEYANYFKAERNMREITVSVAESLPINVLETESVIVLELVATVKESTNLKGSAVLVIKLPATEGTTTESPKFEELYYTGSYKVEDEIGQLTVDSTISLSTEYDDYNSVDVTLEGDYASYFKAERDVREIRLSVAENLPANVLETESVIVLELVATVKDSTNLKGSSVLVIKLPAREETTTDSPKFEELYYTGSYKVESGIGQLTVEGTISLSADYEDYDSVEVTLKGEHASYFEAERELRDVKVSVTDNLPPNILETESVIVVEIVATVKGNPELKGSAALVIRLLDGAGTTTTTTTSTESPGSTIEFEESVYLFNVNPEYVGVIGSVRAVSSSSSESVTYNIYDKEGNTPSNIIINADTGVLSNTEYLTEGYTYYLDISAVGSENGAIAESEVRINVNIRSAYSALVRHITEEEVNYDIVLLSDDYKERGLSYEIHEQYPSDGTDLFAINPETGSLQSVAIDRESSLISSMHLPQFVVTLRIINSEEHSRKKRSYSFDNPSRRFDEYATDERTWVYMENELQNLANQIVVFVVVDDINDNAPSFVNTKQVVGYPNKDLATEVLPAYLTTVQATDPDDGYNSQIYYSTDDDRIYVHPGSGNVYPTDALFSDDDENKLNVKVTATDRNGTGLSTSLTIEVKLLEEDEISILQIESTGLEGVEEKLSELSSLLNLQVGYLTASVIAKTDVSRSSRASTNFYLNIVAYALDSENEPVSAGTLEEKIEALNLENDWSVQTWESHSRENTRESSSGDVGLLVAVIILAILLFIFIAAAGAIVYYFKFRRPNYANMNEDREELSSEVKKEELDPEFAGFKKNPRATNSSTFVKEELPARRPTGHSFYTENETNQTEEPKVEASNAEISAVSSEPVVESEVSPVRERKKSVAFNENVEKMVLEHEEQTTDL